MTHESNGPSWTQDEAIAFEAARECITDLMAIRSGQIHAEQDKPTPDAALLTSLEAERTQLHQQRAALRMADHAQVARVRSEYGAMERTWRSQQATPCQDRESQMMDDLLFVEPTDTQRAAMSEIGSRPGAVGDDANGRLVRVRHDGSHEVLNMPTGS